MICTRFSEDIASMTLYVVNAARSPAVTTPLPSETSGVNFKDDLTGVASR